MILFEQNTTKLSNVVVKEEPFFYDPLAGLKSQLEAAEIALDYFMESVQFDYAEVFKKHELITEAQYEVVMEGAFKNTMTKIGRVILNIIDTIKNTIIGAFRKLSSFFTDKSFQKTIRKFEDNDLSSFKIVTHAINFSRIEDFNKPDVLYNTLNEYEYKGTNVTIKDFGSLFDGRTVEEINSIMNTIESNNFLSKNYEWIFKSTDEDIEKTNLFVSKDEAQLNGMSISLKAQYVTSYNSCRTAIEYAIKDFEKLSRAFRGLEESFKRNDDAAKMKENIPERYEAILKVLGQYKTTILKIARIYISCLKNTLTEIKRVITEGAKGVQKADDEPIPTDEEKSESVKEAAEEDDIDLGDDATEKMDEDEEIEEFAKEDEREYHLLMQEFDHFYNSGDFLDERFTVQG